MTLEAQQLISSTTYQLNNLSTQQLINSTTYQLNNSINSINSATQQLSNSATLLPQQLYSCSTICPV